MRNYRGSLLLVALLFLASWVCGGCGGSSSSGSGGSQTNPVPAIASITPTSAAAGAAGLTLTVTGTNFVSSSSVLWGGTPLTTTYVSGTTLTAQIGGADLLSAGSVTVKVSNPAPGGGSSNGVNFVVNPASSPVPTLTSIDPASADAGAAALTVTVTGTNFVSTSTVLWNGSPLSTSYAGATSLTADVSAADLQTAGTATVQVSNPAPGGGTSNSLTFAINGSSAQGATTINVTANDLAWDAVNRKIYLSLPSADGSNGNSVQALDPTTGTLGASAFAGSEPNLLSVSANGKYLYVGLNGANNLQRMTLPNLGLDITIPLGSDQFNGSYYATDVQASPVTDGTVAVVRGTPNVSPSEEGGVVIYDDGVARAQTLCGFIQAGCTGSGGELFDSIQWKSDETEMYIANNEDTGFDFYTVPVTSAGFGKVTDYGGLVQGFGAEIHYDKVTGYVYDDDGSIINPANGTLIGTFNASGLMVPDGTLGKAFFLGQSQNNFGSSTYSLESFDLAHFTPIATLTLQNIAGTPTHLIRWGANGLAFTTSVGPISPAGTVGTVYLVSGAFVNGSASATTIPAQNLRRSWVVKQALTHRAKPEEEVRRTP